MHEKFEVLKKLGAGDFQHLNGSLEAHLKGTQKILESWSGSETLQTAGLFHAAYGTSAFEENMVSLNQRKEIAAVIGESEEALVYLYCSCDRDHVFSQFGKKQTINFKDRFTNSVFELSETDARLFCELTVANELELVYSSDEFKQMHGVSLFSLFKKLTPYLSKSAKQAYIAELSIFE